jgi:methyl-accepting chemotaxis protein
MRHKRRNFLVNPRFQLRFALFITTWVIGLSLMFPMLLNEAFSIITELVMRDPRGPEVAQVLAAKRDLFRNLYLLESAFVLVVFFLSVFLSHRIAGPIFKLDQYLREAAKTGHLKPMLKFRSGDHFLELAESYNEMVAAVQPESAADSQARKGSKQS